MTERERLTMLWVTYVFIMIAMICSVPLVFKVMKKEVEMSKAPLIVDKKRTEARLKRRDAMRESFLDALTTFLVKDQGSKSIYLEMGENWAREWARLRGSTPCDGYMDEVTARKVLKEFMGW